MSWHEKIADMLGVKGKLVLGDLTEVFVHSLAKNLERIVNKYSHLDSYYILVNANNFGYQIKHTFIITKRKPIKMLGTMLFKVDNRLGEITIEWVLPYDIPRYDAISDKECPELFEYVKGIPLNN